MHALLKVAPAFVPDLLSPPTTPTNSLQCLDNEGRKAQPRELRIWVRGEWFDAAAAYPHEGEGRSQQC